VRAAVLRYRVMAFITGVLIIVVCFAGIPLQLAAHQTFIVNQVGTVHGFLYLVYIVFAWMLAARLKLTRGTTVVLLLAGTIPVMTFVVERWMTRRYITPALAAVGAPAAGPVAAGGGAAAQNQAEGVPPGPR
jgi:integral membrane protein